MLMSIHCQIDGSRDTDLWCLQSGMLHTDRKVTSKTIGTAGISKSHMHPLVHEYARIVASTLIKFFWTLPFCSAWNAVPHAPCYGIKPKCQHLPEMGANPSLPSHCSHNISRSNVRASF